MKSNAIATLVNFATYQSSQSSALATPAGRLASGSDVRASVASSLQQSVSVTLTTLQKQQEEKAMEQYQALSKLRSLPASTVASRRSMLNDRAAMLKQQIDALKKMMVMATKADAKAFSSQLSRLAQELKGIASGLRALNDNTGVGNVSVTGPDLSALAAAGATAQDASGEDPEPMASDGGDAAAVAQASGAAQMTDAAEPVTGGDPSEKDKEEAAGKGVTVAGQDRSDPDAGLRDLLRKLSAALKQLRQQIKGLVSPADRETQDEMKKTGKDLEEADKAIAASDPAAGAGQVPTLTESVQS